MEGAQHTREKDRELRRFRAHDHPGEQSLAVLYGRSLGRPLGAVMIAPMLIGLMLVLRDVDPLAFLIWSFPLAFVAAGAWTSYRLRTTVVEVRVSHNGATPLSPFEVATRSAEPRLQRVFDVQGGQEAITATIGLAVVQLERSRWPDLAELEMCLKKAKAYYD